MMLGSDIFIFNFNDILHILMDHDFIRETRALHIDKLVVEICICQ